jgi:hypothetical protein
LLWNASGVSVGVTLAGAALATTAFFSVVQPKAGKSHMSRMHFFDWGMLWVRVQWSRPKLFMTCWVSAFLDFEKWADEELDSRPARHLPREWSVLP